MIAPTFCVNLNYTYVTMDPIYIGSLYNWNTVVTRKLWESFLISNSTQNKLYHALKF